MPNADLLWNVIDENWPREQKWITIAQAEMYAPRGTAGVDIRASYDFAMLTMLSDRRTYIIHDDLEAENAINGEVHIANRNNGIWRQFSESRIRRA